MATEVKAGGDSDETQAFADAIDEALRGTHRRPGGPDGNPQAVVWVTRLMMSLPRSATS